MESCPHIKLLIVYSRPASIVIFLLILLSRPLAAVQLDANYEILLTNQQTVLTVKACFRRPLPAELVNNHSGATGLLKKAYVVIDDLPHALVVRNGRILLNDLHGQSCMHYQVDFLRAIQMNQDYRYTPEHINHARTRAGSWLWLPPGFENIDLLFHLEDDYRVSAPWQRNELSSATARYRVLPGEDNLESLVYFGRLHQQTLAIANGLVRVNIMRQVDDATLAKLTDWVRYGAEALSFAYARLPFEQLPVYVFPIGAHRSVVPWGEVKRDGGTSVHLYVDETRPLKSIIGDWTLVHELSHSLHPYLSMDGRWLSEGLATYYQNILQARSGVLTSKRAWTKLHEGFERGRAETEAGKSLRVVSENMRENRKFMRVYWSGTALWLQADWLLRTQYSSSLDQVMQALSRCCLPSPATWQPAEFMQQMDQLSKTNLFSMLYKQYADSDEFPDLGHVYTSLGLEASGKQLEFNQQAQHAVLLRLIMQPAAVANRTDH